MTIFRFDPRELVEDRVVTDGELAERFSCLADDLLKLSHLEAALEKSFYRAFRELAQVQTTRMQDR